jgi:hypothetical protein
MATKDQIEISAQRVSKWRALEAQGLTRSEIARREGVSRQRVSEKLGKIEVLPDRKNMRVSVSPTLYDRAKTVAFRLGLRARSGDKAGQGSVSKLIEQIGEGHIVCERIR